MTESRQTKKRRHPVRFVIRHPGFVLFLAVFALTLFGLDSAAGFSLAHLLVAWNAAAAANMLFIWLRMATSSLHRIRARAADLDLADATILTLSVLTALISLAGLFLVLKGPVRDAVGLLDGPVAAFVSVAISFLYVHTLFTVHYAHSFYARRSTGEGLRFPEGRIEPTYGDFLYFAFTIGVALQTADVSVTSSPMRRVVLAHAVLSFFFNTTILALAVNIGSSLVT